MLGLIPEISDADLPVIAEHPGKTTDTAPKPIILRKSRRFTGFIVGSLILQLFYVPILRILRQDRRYQRESKIKTIPFTLITCYSTVNVDWLIVPNNQISITNNQGDHG